MTTTTIPILPKIFSFTSLPQVSQEESFVPRAEVIFTWFNEDITAGGAGDQTAIITMALPINFAYVMVDCELRIDAADAGDIADWDDEAVGSVIENRGDGPTRFLTMAFEGENHGTSIGAGIHFVRIYSFKTLPRSLFQANVRTTNPVSLVVNNPVVGGGAATVAGFVRFLQYDVSQQHHFAVNTPAPVR